ncbi:MAG TPA: hypothetical protein VH413_07130 [Verrucomicrobiae bacterium]|nr:hypothetical protein [Verrucomicrobiae bacterium]
MLRKSRSDASWNALSPEQQSILEGWLFDNHLSYVKALKRATEELGFTGSLASLKRFYQRKSQERMVRDLAESNRDAAEIDGVKVDAERLQRAGLKILAQKFFRRMRDEEIADVGLTSKLVLQAEANGMKRERLEVQRANQELRRERLQFERESWEFSVVEEALGMLPELNELKWARDSAADPDLEDERINAIRTRLFGADVVKRCPATAGLRVEERRPEADDGSDKSA